MTATRERDLRNLRKEQAKERREHDVQRQRTRERMEASRSRNSGPRADVIRQHNAVVTALVPRISGAINGWTRKRVPMSVTYPAVKLHASTDFTKITIAIPDDEITVDFAADLRGFAYHEAGHILKSVPFPIMLDAALPGASHGGQRKFIDKVLGLTEKELHNGWNALEDQRMETAMVAESINLGRYYNVICLNYIVTRPNPSQYLLLYGRRHVDAEVRRSARVAAVDALGAEVVQEAERLIDVYKASTDLLEMWECSVRFARLVKGMGEDGEGVGSVDGHDDYSFDPDEWDDDWDRLADSASDEDEGEAEGDSGTGDDDSRPGGSKDDAGDDDDDSDGDDEGEAESYADGADRGQVGQSDDGPGADASINDRDWSRDLIREALEKAKEERRHDGHIVGDVRAYNEALRANRNEQAIERIPVTPDPDPDVTAQAIRLNRSLRNIMEQARAQAAPTWQTAQRRGVLDVRAYATRQPGDMEIYRDYAPGGDFCLPDMAVSVLLDGSSSMMNYAQDLAIAAFGIKSACDVVNVPCTVMLYDTASYLLWNKDDRPLEVPYDILPNGGTDPKSTLDLIDHQAYDKANHLVIIMTDGAWSGRWRDTYSLAHYQAPGRDMVFFYYRTSPSGGPAGTEACTLVAQINDLQEMPKFLRRYLLKAM